MQELTGAIEGREPCVQPQPYEYDAVKKVVQTTPQMHVIITHQLAAMRQQDKVRGIHTVAPASNTLGCAALRCMSFFSSSSFFDKRC